MPRYFFNVYDGRAELDENGTDLPDMQTARLEAVAVAGRIIADEAHRVALGEDWRMEVTDETGLILFRLDFMVAETAATMDLGPDKS